MFSLHGRIVSILVPLFFLRTVLRCSEPDGPCLPVAHLVVVSHARDDCHDRDERDTIIAEKL